MRSPAPSGRPRLRTSHHADRARVAAALTDAGSVGPTPGIAPRRVQAALTLVARAPDAVRAEDVAAPPEPVPSTGRAVVQLLRQRRALAALAQAEPGCPAPDDRSPGRAAGKPQPEVERLE